MEVPVAGAAPVPALSTVAEVVEVDGAMAAAADAEELLVELAAGAEEESPAALTPSLKRR